MRIVAFDMGTRNFAFCVEDIGDPSCIGTKCKPTFDADGRATDEYQTYLEGVYKSGTLIECIKVDILEFCKTNSIDNIYLGLTMILDKYAKLWDQVDVILIEQQMSYGKNKSNIQALRLSQHCMSYFYCLYANFKTVIEYSSTHKTRMLGCPLQERKTHKSRKQFSIKLANHILKNRDDMFYNHYVQIGKQDDVADCILMIQSYKIKLQTIL